MPNQYRSILKATSVFGGTQFIQIMVGLVRSKFVALLIGTVGMGLNSIYTSSLWIFISIFGMGVNMSVVKDLSRAYEQKDWQRYANITIAFRRLLLVLSIVGTVVVMLFSPLLSKWSFGDSEHIFPFCALSFLLFFTLLSQGNTAVLVSSRRIKSVAACTLVGSIVSLFVAVPFFYFMRLEGVVPGIVFSSMGNYFVTCVFARKVDIAKTTQSTKEWWSISYPLMTLGFAMVISSLLSSIVNYLINLSISRIGSLSDLGLYGAGFAITIQTLTMVFASMGSDYFPRLSGVMNDKVRMNQTINEQSEIILLLSVPILSVFMLVSPIVVRLLLSVEFLPVTAFIRVLCLGMLLRAASYALGYASFAKGDRKVYLLLEGIYGNLSNLVLSVSMYYWWGLTGLAWSFVANYIIYYIVVRTVDSRRYGYNASIELNLLILISVVSIALLLGLSFLLPKLWYYAIGGVITMILCIRYLRLLNNKTGLVNIVLCRIRNYAHH